MVVQWSLIQECLIGIAKLAFDWQANNPSARNLIIGLLAQEAEELREALKADFAVPIKPEPPLGERTQEQLQDWEEHWKEEENLEAKELEADFKEPSNSLEKDGSGLRIIGPSSKRYGINSPLTWKPRR